MSEEEKKAAKDLHENEVAIHKLEVSIMKGKVTSNLIKEMMSSMSMLERVPRGWRMDNGCDLELLKTVKLE